MVCHKTYLAGDRISFAAAHILTAIDEVGKDINTSPLSRL